jgi:NMD protein affecting ribosome stability and mRNA decay
MNAGAARTWVCPLCGARVSEDGSVCEGCPVAMVTHAPRHCGVLCCPRCGYQFVERSSWLESLGRLWRRKDAR